MKKNMGMLDRTIRFLAAVLVAVLYLMHVISGTTALILGFFALMFVLTGFIAFCPLYVPLKISTLKKK